MIKVNFNPETTLVQGYYPDSINYASIPEPFIEITQEQHQASFDKQMCVVNGVFQEYVTPDSILLEQGKIMKIGQCLQYLSDTDWYVIRMSDLSNASEIPQNILTNRTNARTWQKDIKDAMTLEELNNININFD